MRGYGLFRKLPGKILTTKNRYLHFEHIKNEGDASIYKLKNNMGDNRYKDIKDLNEYSDRSWEELLEKLKKDAFYIYVDKAKWNSFNDIIKGHISSFATDTNGHIQKGSCVSLRTNGYREKKYKCTFVDRFGSIHHKDTHVLIAKFIDTEEEIKNFLFKKAEPKVPVSEDRPRYLFEWRLDRLFIQYEFSMPKFLEHIEKVKRKYNAGDFRLYDGVMDNHEVKALNCITGFYSGVDVCGSEPNPSPQMALWSYLNFILGQEVRDNLISTSQLKDPMCERTDDDKLIRGIGL